MAIAISIDIFLLSNEKIALSCYDHISIRSIEDRISCAGVLTSFHVQLSTKMGSAKLSLLWELNFLTEWYNGSD